MEGSFEIRSGEPRVDFTQTVRIAKIDAPYYQLHFVAVWHLLP